jgi:hypothetical protein
MDAEVRQNLRQMIWLLIGLTLLVLVIAIGLSGGGLATTVSIFRTRFLGIFIEAVPFLLLGAMVSGLIDAFVRREDLIRFIPRNRYLATTVGAFLGLAFPVCECGVVPVARRLYGKGLPVSVGIAFLLAAPVMNPIVFASTLAAFGFGSVLILRFALTAVIAIGIGFLFATFMRPTQVLRASALAPVSGGSDEVLVAPLVRVSSDRQSLLKGLGAAVGSATEDFFDMVRYLIIGCILAAALQTVISQEVLIRLGEGPVISVIVMQMLAFILSVCSTVDSFLALAFVGAFSTGSIVSFLTFGPMIDIKSTLMYLGVFQRRAVLILLAMPLIMTLAAGVIINLLGVQ